MVMHMPWAEISGASESMFSALWSVWLLLPRDSGGGYFRLLRAGTENLGSHMTSPFRGCLVALWDEAAS